MSSIENGHVPDQWLGDGFEAARARFGVAGAEPSLAFAALFEAVAWAGTINERLRPIGRSTPELQGLWFIRNRVIHGGADALRWVMVSPGAMLGAAAFGSVSFGQGPTFGWCWAKTPELPPRESQVGAEEYETHLATRNVSTTLATVASHLEAAL
jgi:hypothetical protein